MRKKIGIIVAVVMLLNLMFVSTVFAASASVSASSSSVNIGDTVKVTFKFSADDIGGAEGSFSYDSSVLEYVSAGAGASNGNIAVVASSGGQSSLSTSVTFKAKAAGSTSVSASVSVFAWTGAASLGSASGSTKVTVAGATPTEAPKPTPTKAPSTATANPTTKPTSTKEPDESQEPTPSPSPTPGISETGTAVTILEQEMYIWPSLATLTLPDGYTDGKVLVGGVEIACATSEDGLINLVYATDAEGENGDYFLVYNETVMPFMQIEPRPATYTVLQLTDTTLIPEGFEASVMTVGEAEYPAFTSSDATFYLLYAMDSTGRTGFYAYNLQVDYIEP